MDSALSLAAPPVALELFGRQEDAAVGGGDRDPARGQGVRRGLPKTRSSKITRRLLRGRAQGLPEADTPMVEE